MDNGDESRIVESLLAKTRSGELGWTVGSSDGDDLEAATSKFNYYIGSRDADGRHPFTLEIWANRVGPDGKPNNVRLMSIQSSPFGSGASDDLEHLFEAATRSTVGLTGDLAEAVLKDLGL